MGWKVDEEGVVFKKFLSGKRILFWDLANILLRYEKIVFTTRGGEIFEEKSYFYDQLSYLYEAIPKYNIGFRDEREMEDLEKTYGIVEVNEKAETLKTLVYRIMSPLIMGKYGQEYDLALDIVDNHDFITLTFGLTRNGDYLEAFRDFDDIEVAFLVEWDAGFGTGRYAFTSEAMDEAATESYALVSVKDLEKIFDEKINEPSSLEEQIRNLGGKK